MTERDRLIEELRKIGCHHNLSAVADFILADRKRIVEPLVNLPKRSVDYGDSMHRLAVMQSNAILNTLKLAGVTDEKERK